MLHLPDRSSWSALAVVFAHPLPVIAIIVAAGALALLIWSLGYRRGVRHTIGSFEVGSTRGMHDVSFGFGHQVVRDCSVRDYAIPVDGIAPSAWRVPEE